MQNLDATGQTVAGLIILGILLLLGFAVKFRRRQAERARAKLIELARIEEESSFTDGGATAVLAMVVFNGFALVGFMAASTVLQQTVAILGAISASAFWGVFVMIGRKHVYRVLRDDPALNAEPPAA